MCARFIVENIRFLRQILHILLRGTAPNHCMIENKIKIGALQFCVRSNLWLLSFDDPEYCPLQACFNVETSSSFIFELLAPARLGMTGR